MSTGEGAERSAELEGSPGPGESSLYTLDESEESEEEDDSSNVNGQSGRASGDGSDGIQRQSVPTGDDATGAVDDGDAITDAGVATDENGASQKLSETESDKFEDEDVAEVESGRKKDVKKVKYCRKIEYITPIEDPYQKALKYFAKHSILELFGDITALIVLHRPDNPYNLMVDELVKLHETESVRGHVTPSERRYVPPKKAVSSARPSPEGAQVGRTDAAKGTTDDEERFESLDIEIANMLNKLCMGLKDAPGDTPAQSDSGIALGSQEGSLRRGQGDDQAEDVSLGQTDKQSLGQADKQSEELSLGQKSHTEIEKEVVSGRVEQDEGGGSASTGHESVKKKESNGSTGRESVKKKESNGSTGHDSVKKKESNGSTGHESVKKKESNGSTGHESVKKKESNGSTGHENDKMNSDN